MLNKYNILCCSTDTQETGAGGNKYFLCVLQNENINFLLFTLGNWEQVADLQQRLNSIQLNN